jgi:hypothetical protein
VPKKQTARESPLVVAATALDDELRRFDALADEAKGVQISSSKTLERAIKIVQETTGRHESLQGTLRELVKEIEAARVRQVDSLNVLLEAAKQTQVRSVQYEGLLKRFAALGESARGMTTQAAEARARQDAGAGEAEARNSLAAMEIAMAGVVAEAEALTVLAGDQGWDDLKAKADGVRQQVLALKNKMATARPRSAQN